MATHLVWGQDTLSSILRFPTGTGRAAPRRSDEVGAVVLIRCSYLSTWVSS